MFRITREYWFSAAHRIEGHPKCGRLHGHNYKVEVQVTMDRLDKQGMVLDFGDLDRVVKPIVDELDHRYMISQYNLAAHDPYAVIATSEGHGVELPCQASTAEMLAKYFVEEVERCLRMMYPSMNGNTGITVVVWETPKSTATYQNKV